jgi:ABC-type cobalamin transport system permease subunit
LLGLAGAVAQGLFRNPLADPYLLGSASGLRWVWRWRWPPWAVVRACWAAA